MGDWKGLIIPGRCELEPIFCSLLSCLLVDFVFSDMLFPKHRGIRWALAVGGKNIFNDKSEMENATLKKCKLCFIYLLGFLQKMAKHISYARDRCFHETKITLQQFNIQLPCRRVFAYVSK